MAESLIDRSVGALDVHPRTRLRLLLEAARLDLPVDVISCHIEGQAFAYSKALRPLLEKWKNTCSWLKANKRRNLLQHPVWQFYHAGVRDYPRTYAAIRPRCLRICDPSLPHKAISEVSEFYPSSVMSDFCFAKRENIAHVYHIKGPTEDEPRVCLTFNWRTGNAPPQEKAKLELFSVHAEKIMAAACRIVDDFPNAPDFNDDVRDFGLSWDISDRRIDGIVKIDSAVPEDGTTAFAQFSNYFAWLVHTAATVIGNDDVVALAYGCVKHDEGEDEAGDLAPLSDRLVDSQHSRRESNYSLRPVVVSRALDVDGQSTFGDRLFDETMRMLDSCRPDSGETNDAPWRFIADRDLLAPREKRCGIATLAAQWGGPLFLGDSIRRFNDRIPWYGRAFVELDPQARCSVAVPLVRHLSSSDRSTCFGVIVIESYKRRSLRRSRVAFLSYLLSHAAAQAPDRFFDGKLMIPRYVVRDGGGS